MALVPIDQIDWTKPCEAAAALRARYNYLLGGGQAVEVRFGNDWVKYSTGNIDKLEALILRLESECAKQSTGKPTRYAIRLGAYR